MTEGIVCICSRGLLHSRMMESVDREIASMDNPTSWKRVYSHDLPIPDAQNEVTDRALKFEGEHLWFVEEDIVVPRGTLRALIDVDVHIAIATYKLPGGLMSHHAFRDTGELVYGGLGCTLIHRSTFDVIEEPYWRSDIGYTMQGDASRYEWPYGGQDVQFFMRARDKGLKRQFIGIECDHLFVKEYGQPKTNNGCHVIGQH